MVPKFIKIWLVKQLYKPKHAYKLIAKIKGERVHEHGDYRVVRVSDTMWRVQRFLIGYFPGTWSNVQSFSSEAMAVQWAVKAKNREEQASSLRRRQEQWEKEAYYL